MLTLPLVMALVAVDQGPIHCPRDRTESGVDYSLHTSALAFLPGLESFKDKCLATYGALLLWLVACQVGRRLADSSIEKLAPGPLSAEVQPASVGFPYPSRSRT